MSNWKNQRYHYNNNGREKVKYTSREDALLAAKHVNEKKIFGVDELVEPYECKLCQNWHVGRSSKAKKDTSLWIEIGDRAYYNLIVENTRSDSMRRFRIAVRFRFLGWPYNQNRFR